MPNRWMRSAAARLTISNHLADRSIKVVPLLALADDGLEIFLQDDAILNRVLHDCTHEVGGERLRVDDARAEMSGFCPGADGDGDCLGGRQRAGGGLQLELAIESLTVAQFAKNGDHARDLLLGRRDLRQLEAAANLADALDDDSGLFLE